MNPVSIEVAHALVYIYVAQMVAFSVCIVAIGWSARPITVWLWLVASLLNVLSIFFVAPIGSAYTTGAQPMAMTLALLSADVRYFGLIGGEWRKSRMRLPHAVLIASNSIQALCFVPSLEAFRLLFLSLSGMTVAIAICLAVLRSRMWHGLQGRTLLLLAFGLTVPAFVWRIMNAYPFTDETRFFGNSMEQIQSIVGLLAVSFFYQIGFIMMVRDYGARAAYVDRRRVSRLSAAANVLRDTVAETSRVAKERLDLLNLLSHEVRQPLNNAQAALQVILTQLETPAGGPTNLVDTTVRAQAILDDVTLSLSNAIVGVTVVERGAGATLTSTSVVDVARFAVTDCHVAEQERISLHVPDEVLFLHADPVLLRLALRNLLDNGLKHSPRGSPIDFEITVDEERLGVAFRITNILENQDSVSGDIFAKERRGKSVETEGSGLGLYIVKEVARVHRGQVTFRVESERSVTFELFIPD